MFVEDEPIVWDHPTLSPVARLTGDKPENLRPPGHAGRNSALMNRGRIADPREPDVFEPQAKAAGREAGGWADGHRPRRHAVGINYQYPPSDVTDAIRQDKARSTFKMVAAIDAGWYAV
jgi:hypothetical protein